MALSTTFTQCAQQTTKFGKIMLKKTISLFKVIQTRMLAINVSIPNLKIARLVQF